MEWETERERYKGGQRRGETIVSAKKGSGRNRLILSAKKKKYDMHFTDILAAKLNSWIQTCSMCSVVPGIHAFISWGTTQDRDHIFKYRLTGDLVFIMLSENRMSTCSFMSWDTFWRTSLKWKGVLKDNCILLNLHFEIKVGDFIWFLPDNYISPLLWWLQRGERRHNRHNVIERHSKLDK